MKLSSPMRRLHWLCVFGTALSMPLALALSAQAQSCPAPQGAATATAEPLQAQPTTDNSQNFGQQNLSAERGAAVGNEMVAQSLTGGGGLSGVGAAGVVGFTATPQPLILPGLFTASVVESARPTDRIFSDYGYYSGFRVLSANPAAVGQIVPGFNLNYWDFGVEKTFFDGRASVVVHVPVLDATDNGSGVPVDGFGDITAGLKVAIWENCDTGSVLSGGLLVSSPTARPEHFTTLVSPTGTTTGTTTVNPTFLQPFVVGAAAFDRLYVQDYFAVVVPTDGRVSTFLNNDFSIGFRLYRSDCADRLLSSITPTLDVQTLLPVNHRGLPSPAASGSEPPPDALINGQFGFPDQLFLTEGVQLGIRERASVSFGVVEPLMGPKAFSIGFVTGFNLFF